MANKQSYQYTLRVAVEQMHGCSARFVGFESVREEYKGKIIWEGEVGVFEIDASHTKAKRCYAWSYGEPAEPVVILELPPVDSAQVAVKVGLPLHGR